MIVLECYDPVRREFAGRTLEEEGVKVFVVTMMKLKERDELKFCKVSGRISSKETRKNREG